MTAILTDRTATATEERGSGRVLFYRVVLGGYEEISAPDGTESWDEFVAITDTVMIPDHGPYAPVNAMIDAAVALRWPGFTCIESTYRGQTTQATLDRIAANRLEADEIPF
jgi:hypothetical protein